MIWFTSDEHYSHKNIIEYQNRPFDNVDEMNELMIQYHNDLIYPNDTVYHLGDFAFCDADLILSRLKGNHILIVGSHDKQKSINKFGKKSYGSLWKEIYQNAAEINVLGQTIFLSHYAHRRWPKSHYGSWHLFGHSHGNLESYGYSFDVGVDTHEYTPWSFLQIRDRMNTIKVKEYKIFEGRRNGGKA